MSRRLELVKVRSRLMLGSVMGFKRLEVCECECVRIEGRVRWGRERKWHLGFEAIVQKKRKILRTPSS